MNFTVENSALAEVKIIRGKRFADERGYFSESFKESDFLEIGLPPFVQDNISESKIGVIRGMHWQAPPFTQGKLVTVLHGSILDVAVDVRRESSTFGKHVAVELNSSESIYLWVPEGFAHGFQATSAMTKVLYKVTSYWFKDAEKAINPLDPQLAIKWPIDTPIVSEKDENAPFFNDLF